MQMKLGFLGDQIIVSLNGKQLASVRDATHAHGMFGLGTGWNHAQFGGVSVSPLRSGLSN